MSTTYGSPGNTAIHPDDPGCYQCGRKPQESAGLCSQCVDMQFIASDHARENEPVQCAICYAQGPDVWGIDGYQITLCQSCRIRWRRGLGRSDYDTAADEREHNPDFAL